MEEEEGGEGGRKETDVSKLTSSNLLPLLLLVQTSRQLRPAVLEERSDLIRFRVVENDRDPASMILLTGLKCL